MTFVGRDDADSVDVFLDGVRFLADARLVSDDVEAALIPSKKVLAISSATRISMLYHHEFA